MPVNKNIILSFPLDLCTAREGDKMTEIEADVLVKNFWSRFDEKIGTAFPDFELEIEQQGFVNPEKGQPVLAEEFIAHLDVSGLIDILRPVRRYY